MIDTFALIIFNIMCLNYTWQTIVYDVYSLYNSKSYASYIMYDSYAVLFMPNLTDA